MGALQVWVNAIISRSGDFANNFIDATQNYCAEITEALKVLIGLGS